MLVNFYIFPTLKYCIKRQSVNPIFKRIIMKKLLPLFLGATLLATLPACWNRNSPAVRTDEQADVSRVSVTEAKEIGDERDLRNGIR
jgi:hypothetical protein